MIKSIHMAGIGPHVEQSLHFDTPLGASEVTGSSESGKSTLIDATCFALAGCDRTGRPIDLAEMHDDANTMAVRLELASGTIIERVLHRSKTGGRGKTTRAISGEPMRTEKAFTGALGPLGGNWPALRQVIVPMAWRPLILGTGSGRPFRDILASILPKADKLAIVTELMAADDHEFRRGDPLHEPDAREVRKVANRDRDRAIGDVERLEQLVAAGEAQAAIAGPGDVSVARGLVALSAAWESYDAEVEAWHRREERAGIQSDLATEWDDRSKALGKRPETVDDVLETAQATAKAAEWSDAKAKEMVAESLEAGQRVARQLADAEEDAHPADRFADAVNRARRAVTAAQAALDADDGTCPTCHRDGWEDGRATLQAALAQAEADATSADDERAAEVERLEDERTERIRSLTIQRNALRKSHAANVSQAAKSAEALSVARAAVVTARSVSAPGVEWDRARQALGTRPTVPASTLEPTRTPKLVRPDAADVAQAANEVADADRTAGASEQRAADLGTLRSTLDGSRGVLEELRAECERLDCLVDCVRRAPSEAARRQLGVLGDLGPVEIVMRDDGGVDLMVDARPWHLASTGRLIAADAWLRAGLRRALGLGWLVMFLDEVQSCVGMALPPVAPSIALRTTDGGIEVTR